MNIRDLMVGAVSSLLVTILGGAIVFYITQSKPLKERLSYRVESPSSFKNGEKSVSIQNVRVANSGDVPAKNVLTSLSFPKDAHILENTSSLSSGAPSSCNISSKSEGKISILCQNVLPNEAVVLTFLLDGVSLDVKPVTTVRSESALGVEETEITSDKLSRWDFLTKYLVPGAVVIQLPLLYMLFSKRDGIFSGLKNLTNEDTLSANNVAFVMLHGGLPNEAEAVLHSTIVNRGGSVFELLNYALCKGIKGNVEEAGAYLRSAFWWAKTNHAKSVYYFNCAILAAREKDFKSAVQNLKDAFELSYSEVLRYCKLSIYISEARESDASFDMFVQKAESRPWEVLDNYSNRRLFFKRGVLK